MFEPKFGGFRALAFCDRDGVVLQSRQLRPLTDAFPDITTALAPLAERGVVLDGGAGGVAGRPVGLRRAAGPAAFRPGPGPRPRRRAGPAAFVVFDLLAHRRTDLRELPYSQRRTALEKLLRTGLPAGVVLTPTTTDPAVAHTWLAGHTTSGIERVVGKRADQPYRPGVRGWQKLRARLTGEAVVAGVIGPPTAPRVLLLGRSDGQGRLQVAGRSTDLPPATAAAVGAVLRRHPGPGHPWPELLPRSSWADAPPH